MAQGKFKVKNKAPIDLKKKTKSIARKNCPAKPTKWKYVEGQRIKKLISKDVNRRMEEEIRSVVSNEPKVFNSKKSKSEKSVVSLSSSKLKPSAKHTNNLNKVIK